MMTETCGTVELETALIIFEPFLVMPRLLEVGADDEAGDVVQEHQRHIDLVAQLDELGRLFRAISEKRAPLLPRMPIGIAVDATAQPVTRSGRRAA